MSRHEDQVAFRLPRRAVEQLDARAEREGRSRSELLREAVASYLAQVGGAGSRAAEPSWGEGVRAPDTLERVVRAGVRALQQRPYRATTFNMGGPLLPSLDKSLRIAAALEDEETARELALRK